MSMVMSSTKGNKRRLVFLIIEQKLGIRDKIRRKVAYVEILGFYSIGKSTICNIRKSESKMGEFASTKEQFEIKRCKMCKNNEEIKLRNTLLSLIHLA